MFHTGGDCAACQPLLFPTNREISLALILFVLQFTATFILWRWSQLLVQLLVYSDWAVFTEDNDNNRGQKYPF